MSAKNADCLRPLTPEERRNSGHSSTSHSADSRTPAKPLRALEDYFLMEKVWQPIATAPANIELELSIYDKGEYHPLAFPCQREGLGWRNVRASRSVVLEPTHWRLWARLLR
jgi:hypothetical protein